MRPAPYRPLPLAAAAACAALLLTGCPERPPKPLEVPTLSLRTAMFAGSPVTGPATGPPAAAARARLDDALSVRVHAFGLEGPGVEALEPASASAQLVLRSAQPAATLLAPEALRGARYGELDQPGVFVQGLLAAEAPGRAVFVERLYGALPPGATAVFSVDVQGATDRIEVSVHRLPAAHTGDESTIEVGLELVDGSAPWPHGADELVLFDPGRLEGRRPHLSRALSAPLPTSRAATVAATAAPARGLAFVIDVAGPPDPASVHYVPHRRAVADLEARLARAALPSAPPPRTDLAATTTSTSAGTATSAPAAPVVDAAAAARAFRQRPGRGPLAALAAATGAQTLAAVNLALDDAGLQALTRAVEATLPPEGPPSALSLERAAFETVRPRLLGADQPPPALLAALGRRVGGLIEDPLRIFDLLGAASDAPDLERRLVDENLDLLATGPPAARAHAYRWLGERGLAPAGYDPLGSSAARRAALREVRDP